jgi:hypothetical protein
LAGQADTRLGTGFTGTPDSPHFFQVRIHFFGQIKGFLHRLERPNTHQVRRMLIRLGSRDSYSGDVRISHGAKNMKYLSLFVGIGHYLQSRRTDGYHHVKAAADNILCNGVGCDHVPVCAKTLNYTCCSVHVPSFHERLQDSPFGIFQHGSCYHIEDRNFELFVIHHFPVSQIQDQQYPCHHN